MMIDVRALVLTLLADDVVRAALRSAIGSASVDPWIPIGEVARMLGIRQRVLIDAARRGDLEIHGPRGARVVRRSEIDRWLGAHGISRSTPGDREKHDEHAEARAAIDAAVARIRRTA